MTFIGGSKSGMKLSRIMIWWVINQTPANSITKFFEESSVIFLKNFLLSDKKGLQWQKRQGRIKGENISNKGK